MVNNSRDNLCCQNIIYYSGRGDHLWKHVCKETVEYTSHNLRQKFQNQRFLQNVIKVKKSVKNYNHR